MRRIRMTDQEVIQELQSKSVLNQARQIFSSERARIERAGEQRDPLSPIEMRRMEFEAIEKIAGLYAANS